MRIGVTLFVLMIFAGCQEEPKDPQRPYEYWARRSVLDQRPRMLTLALSTDHYVAYDVEKCGLYKLWQGGVFWDGAAFNNIKTVQPTTWGESYWEETPDEKTWHIKWDQSEATIKPQFKGYKIQNNRITLQYALVWDKFNIAITEQPDWRNYSADSLIFQRIIQTKGIPEKAQLFYQGFPLKANSETLIEQGFSTRPTPPPPIRSTTSNNSQYWLDRSGCNTCHRMEEQAIGPSYQAIASRYGPDTEQFVQLVKKVKEGGTGVWGEIPMNPHPQLAEQDIRNMLRYILSLESKGKPIPKRARKLTTTTETRPKKPGFGAPLEAVHPSFDIQNIRPSWFQPRVGAMDFHPDGRLLLTTWDSIGALYALEGVESGDTNQISIERIATGLSEPLGMKIVDQDIFVLQKQELSQLIDEDKDGVIDEYRTICDAFAVRPDFHEYSYGLAYKDGFFYANLGLAMRLMSHEVQLEDRGTAIKMDLDGNYQRVATGLRQANGIGIGPEGEIFLTENQGQWVPACKIIHLQEGHFYGCQYQTGDRYENEEATPPAVWLPHHEIGNSPGQILSIDDGVYKGQMLHGEVTHGGIKRVYLEKVKGAYQGAVFRFSQGLEAGINRLVWGPEGALYVGGVGMNGNWGWKGKQFGLQKLVPNGKVPFEILALRAQAEGIEIEFTVPLGEQQGEKASDYFLEQWRYEATPSYGGPKLDQEELKIAAITVSSDRRRVQLNVPNMKEGFVIYLLLNDTMRSKENQRLWSGEAWYTLNQKP